MWGWCLYQTCRITFMLCDYYLPVTSGDSDSCSERHDSCSLLFFRLLLRRLALLFPSLHHQRPLQQQHLISATEPVQRPVRDPIQQKHFKKVYDITKFNNHALSFVSFFLSRPRQSLSWNIVLKGAVHPEMMLSLFIQVSRSSRDPEQNKKR